MQMLFEIYDKFLSIFPESLQGAVSFILAIILVISIIQTLKKSFIWLIVLVILLPASIPILKNLASSAVEFVKYLIEKF